jgi:hypothetical protein
MRGYYIPSIRTKVLSPSRKFDLSVRKLDLPNVLYNRAMKFTNISSFAGATSKIFMSVKDQKPKINHRILPSYSNLHPSPLQRPHFHRQPPPRFRLPEELPQRTKLRVLSAQHPEQAIGLSLLILRLPLLSPLIRTVQHHPWRSLRKEPPLCKSHPRLKGLGRQVLHLLHKTGCLNPSLPAEPPSLNHPPRILHLC